MKTLFLRQLVFWSVFLLFALEAKAHEGEHENASPRVGYISVEQQTALEARVKAKSFWSYGFGPFVNSQSSNRDGKTNFGASITRHFEVHPNGEIRTSLTSTFDTHSVSLFSIGGAWLVSTSSFAPYIGAELGGGYGSEFGFGWGGKAIAGARFFRTASKQLDVGVTYMTLFEDSKSGTAGAQLSLLF